MFCTRGKLPIRPRTSPSRLFIPGRGEGVGRTRTSVLVSPSPASISGPLIISASAEKAAQIDKNSAFFFCKRPGSTAPRRAFTQAMSMLLPLFDSCLPPAQCANGNALCYAFFFFDRHSATLDRIEKAIFFKQ
jgi:hypothetical protein